MLGKARGFSFALAVVSIALILGPVAAFAQNAKVTLLTINDVYEISPKGGLGGMAELMTLLKKERAANPNTITTINGDFLSPSVMSGLTKGAQMIDLFNAIGVDVVSLGNHEFDYGPDVLKARIAEGKFVWVNSNVLGRDGKPFPGTVRTFIKQVGDVMVGFFALLTEETTTLSSPGEGIYFNPPMEAAKAAVDVLKTAGANVIVAMTHMNIQDDRALARTVKGIHVILGGHDHDPITFYEGGVLILKSGADSAFLGAIDLDIRSRTANNQTTTTVIPQWRMTVVTGITPDPDTVPVVAKWTKLLDDQLGVVIGKTNVELDSRRSTVRADESNMGNLIADAI
ncbi:MAG: bifunctional metallophosphatase/5'-nucleotidase, partial [Pseudomonadota bacterium]